jgi:hypothetical protein
LKFQLFVLFIGIGGLDFQCFSVMDAQLEHYRYLHQSHVFDYFIKLCHQMRVGAYKEIPQECWIRVRSGIKQIKTEHEMPPAKLTSRS